MTSLEREAAVVELLKAENELRQLRSENKWLREANKSLSEALDKARTTGRSSNDPRAPAGEDQTHPHGWKEG